VVGAMADHVLQVLLWIPLWKTGFYPANFSKWARFSGFLTLAFLSIGSINT
jgi:hypothetical protein